jgi:cytochrome c oxidase subunit 1
MATLEVHAPVPSAKKKSLIWDLMTTIDHKKIGIMYGVTALVFLIVGGLEALLIRIQLSRPENDFISADVYNQLFTMHGTTMERGRAFKTNFPPLITPLPVYVAQETRHRRCSHSAILWS